jgi:hypothetical protein
MSASPLSQRERSYAATGAPTPIVEASKPEHRIEPGLFSRSGRSPRASSPRFSSHWNWNRYRADVFIKHHLRSG